jgi:hypothetical protein
VKRKAWIFGVLIIAAVLVAVFCVPKPEVFTATLTNPTNGSSEQIVTLMLSNRSIDSVWVNVFTEAKHGERWSPEPVELRLRGMSLKVATYGLSVGSNEQREFCVAGPESTKRWRVRLLYRKQLKGWHAFGQRLFAKCRWRYPFERTGSKTFEL